MKPQTLLSSSYPQQSTRALLFAQAHRLVHPPTIPMSFTVATGVSGGGARILCGTNTPYASLPHRPLHLTFPPSPSSSSNATSRTHLHVVSASKRSSPRSGRFDGKSRRGSTTTTQDPDPQPTAQIEGSATDTYDGYFLPDLPGEEPDFWEGPQWDALGFFVEYMWAFGLPFAIIAIGIAVAAYNDGATDFKETPAYKESVQSSELLEGPEASDSDVFESNPTEVAPGLE